MGNDAALPAQDHYVPGICGTSGSCVCGVLRATESCDRAVGGHSKVHGGHSGCQPTGLAWSFDCPQLMASADAQATVRGRSYGAETGFHHHHLVKSLGAGIIKNY